MNDQAHELFALCNGCKIQIWRFDLRSAQRRYSKQEIARRGEDIYESKVRPQLKSSDDGRFVAIDIETADYELDDDELAAGDQLHVRNPDAQIWIVRVGSSSVHRLGGRLTKANR